MSAIIRVFNLAALAGAAMLAACGGGGGGGSSGGLPMLAMAPVAGPTAPVAAPAAPTRDCSVTLYGDSILNGSTFKAGRIAEPPAAAIQRMHPAYRVVDRSVAGDNAQMRMPVMVNDAIDTHIVVIEQGINDAGNSLPYEAPLRAMVQRAKALSKLVVVTGISQAAVAVANRDAYDAIARRVAAEEGVTFADWGAVPVVIADMADDVHPAQAQSTRLVEKLVKALDQVAPECKP
ncbi:SGNH/GDSL hydrolase family protein [Variovorax sp. ZT5P49]|uniref:SGNH/GDSL hydrolase family protein n=1 Tax=Variovorax sp. ZT5P49 TaxID=3443733 RepID=UPI003F44B3D3